MLVHFVNTFMDVFISIKQNRTEHATKKLRSCEMCSEALIAMINEQEWNLSKCKLCTNHIFMIYDEI